MSVTQLRAVNGYYRLPKPTATAYECELDVPLFRHWSSMLSSAGGVLSDSPLHGLNEKALPSFKPGKKDYALLHFERFISSERVLRLAKAEGYRKPAHPRAVLKAADDFDSGLPEELKLTPPYSLVSLMTCYKEYGEKFVLRVEWDKELKRSPGAVHYDYGWEPEYWFLFEA